MTQSVLRRIEEDSLQPRSKLSFQFTEYSVWSLWVASVLVGAVAFAVIEMVWQYRNQDFFEATHESLFEFVLEMLPYLWAVLFLVMVGLAYLNFKRTKKGYKYPFFHIVISCLVFSILGGVLLQWVGLGALVDQSLGKYIPMYLSQEETELKMWQKPTEGRLVGRLIDSQAGQVFLFKDAADFVWRLEVSELQEFDMKELLSQQRVRVLGMIDGAETFHVCGVFPWFFAENFHEYDMKTERQNFIARMYAHKNAAEEVISERTRKCAEMSVVNRIKM